MKHIENSLLEAWLNGNDLPGVEVDVISLIPSEFWASLDQNESLDGDMCSKETEWATLRNKEVSKRITFN